MQTWLTVTAERAVSRAMGGSCSVPLAAHGRWNGDTLTLDAAWGDVDGVQALIRAQAQSAHVTDLASADALGVAVADKLKAAGAKVSTGNA